MHWALVFWPSQGQLGPCYLQEDGNTFQLWRIAGSEA